MLCSRVRFWEEDILTAEIEELEKLDASETYPRRLNAKEVLITQIDGEFVFLVADGSATLSGRDYEFQEPTRRLEFTVRRESQRRISWRWEEFQPEETEDDAEAREDFWSIQGDFIYRHHIEPIIQLFVRREEPFLIPLQFFDVNSIPPIQQNSMKNGCDENHNYNKYTNDDVHTDACVVHIMR